jgi:UDP-glucose 4-epimerase
LVSEDYAVTLVTRRSALPPDLSALAIARVVQIDEGVSTERMFATAIAQNPVVFNLAGLSGAARSNVNLEASLDGNCRIQAAFLRACELAGNRPHVVFASSRLVYGGGSVLPVDETAPLAPRSAYAAHKLCVEHYHQIAAMRGKITFTTCRISNPYGFYHQGSSKGYGFINDLIQRGCKGLPLTIYGDGSQIRDYIHISDLVAALKLSGWHSAARNEVFNIGRGEGISIADAAKEIHTLTGALAVHSPWPLEDSLVESGDYIACIQKAASRLGFKPRIEFSEGLRDTLGARKSVKDDVPTTGTLTRTAAWA